MNYDPTIDDALSVADRRVPARELERRATDGRREGWQAPKRTSEARHERADYKLSSYRRPDELNFED